MIGAGLSQPLLLSYCLRALFSVGKTNMQEHYFSSFSIILWVDQRVLVRNQISFIGGFGVQKSEALFWALSCSIFNNNL